MLTTPTGGILVALDRHPHHWYRCHLMSRSDYDRHRSIHRHRGLCLPEWGTVRRIRNQLKARLGLKVARHISPVGTPCFSLRLKDILSRVSANQVLIARGC